MCGKDLIACLRLLYSIHFNMAALDLSKLSKFIWFQQPFSKAYEVKNYSVATIICER